MYIILRNCNNKIFKLIFLRWIYLIFYSLMVNQNFAILYFGFLYIASFFDVHKIHWLHSIVFIVCVAHKFNGFDALV